MRITQDYILPLVAIAGIAVAGCGTNEEPIEEQSQPDSYYGELRLMEICNNFGIVCASAGDMYKQPIDQGGLCWNPMLTDTLTSNCGYGFLTHHRSEYELTTCMLVADRFLIVSQEVPNDGYDNNCDGNIDEPRQ